jgi:rhomboid family protein
MLPLSDDVPARHFPWLNWLLILANVAVYVYMLELPPGQLDRFVQTYSVVPARLLADPSTAQMATLVTSMFLHASLLHIGGNMLVLWIFGDNVEDRLGAVRYLALYFACGVVAGLTQVASAPQSTLPGLGASGAIAGVLAAYALWYPRARVAVLVPILILPWLVTIPALIVIGLWIALQVISGLAVLGQPALAASGGVAWWAHIGGFAAGLILGPLLLLTRSAGRRAGRGRRIYGAG